MELKKLDLTIDAFSKGGQIIVTDIAPEYRYVDGERDLSKVIGLRVTAVFPGNGYESQIVKVSNPVDRLTVLLEKATPDKPLRVTFVNFHANIYTMRGNDGRWRTGISAKAEDVKPVDDDFDIVIE